jgi:hypothetical protein
MNDTLIFYFVGLIIGMGLGWTVHREFGRR